MPDSLNSPQNRSNDSSKGERTPVAVVGAAGRITMLCAPWSRAQLSSSTAQSASARVRYGAA